METSQVVSELNPFQAWPLGQCMDQSLMWSFTWYGVKTKPSRTSQASGRVGGRATPKTLRKGAYFGTIPFTVARRAFGVFLVLLFSYHIFFWFGDLENVMYLRIQFRHPGPMSVWCSVAKCHVSLLWWGLDPSGTDHRQKSSPCIELQVTRPQTLEDTVHVYTYKYVYKSLDDLDTVILFELNDCNLSFLIFFCCSFVVVCLGSFKKHSR